MASISLGVRERIVAASKRIRRVKRVDWTARAFITAGGIFIIVSVLFIFLFITAETLPLFRSASAERLASLSLAAAASPQEESAPLAIGVDEYQKYIYQILPDAKVAFYRADSGDLHREFPIAGLEGARLTAASRSLQGDFFAAGTDDGRIALLQVRFRPVFEGQILADLDIEVRDRGLVTVDGAARPVRDASYWESPEGGKSLAALVGESEIVLVRFGDEGSPVPETLHPREGERVTRVRLGRNGELVAATESGRIHHWDIGGEEVNLSETIKVSDVDITALEYGLGGNTIIVGDGNGALSAWFRARPNPDAAFELVKAHAFESQGAPIVSIGSSTRERSFVTGGADGSVFLRHLTSERTLLRFEANQDAAAVDAALISPRADGILVRRSDGTLDRYSLRNPHPEFSWHAIWGKVWYEGYSEPEYVWQSTGGTDDFEPKLSLVPLVFGTIKATFYALIFAVPLSVMAALYTSQFVHPTIRAKVKPTVETMAALPSVVIGFIAGLWLSSRVEASVVPVLLLTALLPLFGTAGVLFWERLPQGMLKRLRPGMEVLVILPLLVAGGAVTFWIGSSVENLAFGGDFKGWLSSSLGLVYDQRNSLVVGIAMGFAVIPIIFTISEDAFSSVPRHLAAASLALGASRWQTATRVVLPTASPGIFSAIMVGFGRAVGETMIVLMATGNTPLLDWSPFNGMRTLSANTAVEIPEAPYGGTLYRVLFLSAAVLFLMTFVVNTVAELVRQRLREKYKAICLLMIFGLLAIILVNGLGIFWPHPIEQVTTKDGSVLAGEIVQRQAIPNPGHDDHLRNHRIQLRTGNRDLYGVDFIWVNEADIVKRERPAGIFFVERAEYGPLVGTPVGIADGDREIASEPNAVREKLPELVARAARDREAIDQVEKDEIGEVNYQIERLRLEARRLDFREGREPGLDLSAERKRIQEGEERERARYGELEAKLGALLESAAGTRVSFVTVDGQQKELRSLDIYRAYAANELSVLERAGTYASRLWDFLTDEPREANTEGGILPAIFGTVMMVFLMSLAVVPLGVLAALYLREYAKQGLLVRTVRVAVNNLAGVPSIVFGVFGLGFFVYFVGGGIDRMFFPEALPTPTYGTGGILWASLTLALLTVPVVIVASEEALSAVPRSMREASLAMGATKFQTIRRVVLPAAAPGILTGLILAMARAAGEVAPLMLTGVVKLAPELPLDSFFPFFHLDRKFMHLGFHIYDVGFQSPNVEAAKPMVYTTAVFLLLIVVLLNLTAIWVRNYLREKYRTAAF